MKKVVFGVILTLIAGALGGCGDGPKRSDAYMKEALNALQPASPEEHEKELKRKEAIEKLDEEYSQRKANRVGAIDKKQDGSNKTDRATAGEKDDKWEYTSFPTSGTKNDVEKAVALSKEGWELVDAPLSNSAGEAQLLFKRKMR